MLYAVQDGRGNSPLFVEEGGADHDLGDLVPGNSETQDIRNAQNNAENVTNGSMLLAGLRSSKYPLPVAPTDRGIRMDAPRLATPLEKEPM